MRDLPMRRPKIDRVQCAIGLDLSLRASAACAIPLDWGQRLDRVVTEIFGSDLKADAKEEERLRRIDEIATGVSRFIRSVSTAPKIFLESYAFAQSGSHAREVAELTGLVKWSLWKEWGEAPTPIVASRARKILLQKLPRKDVKSFVHRNVKRIPGADGWTNDEADSFTIANVGVMLMGGVAMTFEGT